MPQSELLRYLEQLPLDGITSKLSNREVIDPHSPIVFSHLDFLQMTMQSPRQWGKDKLSLPFLSELLTVKSERHGVKNYRYGANLSPAGLAFWNTKNEELPGLLVLGGSDLGVLRGMSGLSDDKLMQALRPAAISFTRIDFATNINRGHPRQALRHFRLGKTETRIRNAERIDQHAKNKKGYTVYFGSQNSDKYIRCYDKAAELKISGEVLTRIEMQITGKPADRLAKQMRQTGVKNTGKQAIRDFLQFPELSWWAEATEGDEVDMQLTPAKETSFGRWLTEQVLPAIQKRIEAGEESEAITGFTRALLALYGDLGEVDSNQ